MVRVGIYRREASQDFWGKAKTYHASDCCVKKLRAGDLSQSNTTRTADAAEMRKNSAALVFDVDFNNLLKGRLGPKTEFLGPRSV